MHVLLLAVFLLFALWRADPACAAGSALFADDEAIRVTLTAPMRKLTHERRKKLEYDALLMLADPAGAPRELPIKLAPRGNSRLEACAFPPLRITLDPEQASGTVVENQRELKLVTQCEPGSDAANWLLLEYGIYRGYNVISDFSLRVRRVEMTYRDSESVDRQRTEVAFLIEPEAEAAGRLQRESISPARVNPEQFDKAETARSLLFQYLIGNTDFEVTQGRPGDPCCHNGRVVAPPGSQTGWIVLPYDFDQSGLIHTDYALPYPKFPINDVRTRLFRGFCWHGPETQDAIALFNQRREQIVAALLPEGLAERSATQARKYIDRFYEIVNDPERLGEQIVDACRGAGR